MDDLVEWYRQQLDEDERIARRGFYSETHWESFTTTAHLGAWQAWREHFPREQWDTTANDAVANAARDSIRERITAHEADRTAQALREIEAKRGIVARYEFACREAADERSNSEEEREVWVQVAGALQSCVLCFAAIYADRPGYDEAVRP